MERMSILRYELLGRIDAGVPSCATWLPPEVLGGWMRLIFDEQE